MYRGISRETLMIYDIYCMPRFNLVFFADFVDENNKTTIWQSRHLYKKEFFIPPNTRKPLIWYKAFNKSNPVVIVEGFVDALSVKEVRPDITPCVLLGKDITEYQMSMLDEDREHYVMLDSYNESNFIYNKIKDRVRSSVIYSEADPNDLLVGGHLHNFLKEI